MNRLECRLTGAMITADASERNCLEEALLWITELDTIKQIGLDPMYFFSIGTNDYKDMAGYINCFKINWTTQYRCNVKHG